MSIISAFIKVPFENWLTGLFFESTYLFKYNEFNFLHGVKGSLGVMKSKKNSSKF